MRVDEPQRSAISPSPSPPSSSSPPSSDASTSSLAACVPQQVKRLKKRETREFETLRATSSSLDALSTLISRDLPRLVSRAAQWQTMWHAALAANPPRTLFPPIPVVGAAHVRSNEAVPVVQRATLVAASAVANAAAEATPSSSSYSSSSPNLGIDLSVLPSYTNNMREAARALRTARLPSLSPWKASLGHKIHLAPHFPPLELIPADLRSPLRTLLTDAAALLARLSLAIELNLPELDETGDQALSLSLTTLDHLSRLTQRIQLLLTSPAIYHRNRALAITKWLKRPWIADRAQAIRELDAVQHRVYQHRVQQWIGSLVVLFDTLRKNRERLLESGQEALLMMV